MSSVGIESILTSKNMEVSYFNPVCEESSSLTAKEEKALPGICSPSEEEKINGEVEKAGELLVLILILYLLCFTCTFRLSQALS